MMQSDEGAVMAAGHATVLVVDADEADADRAVTALDGHAPSLAVERCDADTLPALLSDSDADADPAGVVAPLDGDGNDLLRSVRDVDPTLPVVLIGDAPGVETVEAAVAAGATDVVDFSATPPSLVATRVVNAVARGRAGTAEPSMVESDDTSHGHTADSPPSHADADLTALKERALDEAAVGIVISAADEDNSIIFANEGFGRLTGYDPDAFVGRNCRILQGPETDERPVRTMREAIEEGRHSSVVLTNYRADGTEFWNEVEINPIRDDTGTLTHFIGFQRDVTERKRLEGELVAARQSLRQLYTLATDTSLSFDERVKRTLAVGRDRLGVNLGFVTNIADDTQTVVHAVGDHDLLQPGEACPLSESYCRRTLETEGLLAVVHAAADEGWDDDPAYDTFGLECYLGGKITVDGELYGTLCFADETARDEPFSESQAVFVELLTRWIGYELEQRAHERELRVANRRFQSLFDNPMTFAGILDTDGTLLEANDTARATLDEDASIVGFPFWEAPWWRSDEATATVKAAVERAARGEVATYECAYTHAGGEGTVGVTIYPVYGVDDGETESVVSLMAIGADTTQRTEQAAQLKRQRDRFEEFASVVSHDLRSPLEVARGRLQLYEATGDDEHLDSIEESLDRISTLIEDLLTLARQGDAVADVEPTPIQTVARQAWGTVSTETARLVVDADELTVEADPGRLQQLLENLFRNSREHAVPANESETDAADAPELTIRLTDLADRQGFAVEDDGRGIPPDHRDSVFERGYTTNDDGTGFGLAIVERIAEAHGWSVSVTESDAGGARFEFEFDR